jgi:hypothetical protein
MRKLKYVKLFENFVVNESIDERILSYHKTSLPYLKSFIEEGISYDNFSSGHGQGKGFYMYCNIEKDKGFNYTKKANLVAGLEKNLIIGKYIDINFSNIRVDYELVKQKLLLLSIWNIFKEMISSNDEIILFSINRRNSIAGNYQNENLTKLNDESILNHEGEKIDNLLNNNLEVFKNLKIHILIYHKKDKSLITLLSGGGPYEDQEYLTVPSAEKLVKGLNEFKKTGIDIFEKLDTQIYKKYKEEKETLPIKLIKVEKNTFPDYFWILENNNWIKYTYSEAKKKYDEIKKKYNIEEEKVDFTKRQLQIGIYDSIKD